MIKLQWVRWLSRTSLSAAAWLLPLTITDHVMAADAATAPSTQPLGLLGTAKIAMQGKEYARAIKDIDEYLRSKPKDVAEAQYLKALALHYDGKYTPSIDAAQVILDQYKD